MVWGCCLPAPGSVCGMLLLLPFPLSFPSGCRISSCWRWMLLCAWIVDGDAPQWTQFHGWLGIQFEQCKWWDSLKSCFPSFPHFGDGDTHRTRRLSEVCNRSPGLELQNCPHGPRAAAVGYRGLVEAYHLPLQLTITIHSRLSQPLPCLCIHLSSLSSRCLLHGMFQGVTPKIISVGSGTWIHGVAKGPHISPRRFPLHPPDEELRTRKARHFSKNQSHREGLESSSSSSKLNPPYTGPWWVLVTFRT